MKRNVFGTVMTYYQKKYDLQQNAIYEGICSATTFSRIKKRERDVDFLAAETFLARVGRDASQFELLMSEDDFDLWMQRQEIKSDIWEKNIGAAEEKIERYKRDIAQMNAIYALPLHEQFWEYCEAKLAELAGKPAQNICEHAKKALALTRNVKEMPDIKQNLYTSMELELLLTLVSLKDGEWKKTKKAKECLERIRDYIDFYYPEEGMEETKGIVWLELLKIEEQEQKWEEMLIDIEKAIADLARGTGILHLAQLRFLKAQVLEKMQCAVESDAEDNGENYQERINCVKEECKMAYCIFEVMGREEQVKEVENFCQEKLGWQITI